jgi:hypothetical protein
VDRDFNRDSSRESKEQIRLEEEIERSLRPGGQRRDSVEAECASASVGIRAQILFVYCRQKEQEGDIVLKLCKDCL